LNIPDEIHEEAVPETSSADVASKDKMISKLSSVAIQASVEVRYRRM